jgi:hypothetical protein
MKIVDRETLFGCQRNSETTEYLVDEFVGMTNRQIIDLHLTVAHATICEYAVRTKNEKQTDKRTTFADTHSKIP